MVRAAIGRDWYDLKGLNDVYLNPRPDDGLCLLKHEVG